MLLQAATLTALASLVAAAFSVHKGRRLRAELAAAHRRLELLGAPLIDDAEDQRAVGASALRRDERRKFDADEDGYYRGLRKLLLADFRDVAGAEEAVFWRWSEEREGFDPESWSSEGSGPSHFDVARWSPHVVWTAEMGVVQTAGENVWWRSAPAA